MWAEFHVPFDLTSAASIASEQKTYWILLEVLAVVGDVLFGVRRLALRVFMIRALAHCCGQCVAMSVRECLWYLICSEFQVRRFDHLEQDTKGKRWSRQRGIHKLKERKQALLVWVCNKWVLCYCTLNHIHRVVPFDMVTRSAKA
jgi:hypothetical protein